MQAQTILRDVDPTVADAREERALRTGLSWGLLDPWASQAVEAFEETTAASACVMRRDDLSTALERRGSQPTAL
ncbi:hypothetical protein [Brevibacterium sediminis]